MEKEKRSSGHCIYETWRKLFWIRGLSQENNERTNGNQCSRFIRNWDPICLLGILAKGMSLKFFLTIIQGITMNRPCKWFMKNYIIFFIIILAQRNNYPLRNNLQPYKIRSILSRSLLVFTGFMILAFKYLFHKYPYISSCQQVTDC